MRKIAGIFAFLGVLISLLLQPAMAFYHAQIDAKQNLLTPEGTYVSDGEGGFFTPNGEHVMSDGKGGFFGVDGHYTANGKQGLIAPDGNVIESDGKGGYIYKFKPLFGETETNSNIQPDSVFSEERQAERTLEAPYQPTTEDDDPAVILQ